MELPVGFEPTIRCLQGRCITVVLQEHDGDPREIRTHTSRIKSPVSLPVRRENHDGIPCRIPTRIPESVAPCPLR